ncbi:MAG: HNH endonuclease signature motif containing protein [Planctomycetota bacterium]
MKAAPKFRRFPKTARRVEPRRDNREGSAADRGYDWEWSKFADALKSQPDFATCLVCRGQGRAVSTDAIDHIVPLDAVGKDLKFERANLQPLCRSCHTTKTAAIDKRARGYFLRLTRDGVCPRRAMVRVATKFKGDVG